jgi:hypothetical protein
MAPLQYNRLCRACKAVAGCTHHGLLPGEQPWNTSTGPLLPRSGGRPKRPPTWTSWVFLAKLDTFRDTCDLLYGEATMGKSLGAGEIHYGDSPIETRLAKSLSYHGLVLREQTPSFASVAGERLVAYRTFTASSGYSISYARSVRNLLLENVFGKPTADRIVFDYLHRVYPDTEGTYNDVRLDLLRLGFKPSHSGLVRSWCSSSLQGTSDLPDVWSSRPGLIASSR